MLDGVIAGTGDSRYLKTVSNFLTLYPTYAEFAAAFVAGTLPVDFNGINAAKWTAVGTALSKANILPDATATLLGLTPGDDPAIKDAFNALAVLSGASAPTTGTVGVVKQFYLKTSAPVALYQCTAASGGVYTWSQMSANVSVATGSYTGTGTYGSDNPVNLSFDFTPKFFVVSYAGHNRIMFIVAPEHATTGRSLSIASSVSSTSCSLSWSDGTLSWYNTSSADAQFNVSGTTYYYFAIG